MIRMWLSYEISELTLSQKKKTFNAPPRKVRKWWGKKKKNARRHLVLAVSVLLSRIPSTMFLNLFFFFFFWTQLFPRRLRKKRTHITTDDKAGGHTSLSMAPFFLVVPFRSSPLTIELLGIYCCRQVTSDNTTSPIYAALDTIISNWQGGRRRRFPGTPLTLTSVGRNVNQ